MFADRLPAPSATTLALSLGGRRHAVSRRSGRDAARCAGQAAARPETHTVIPVGGRESIRVDVRIVAATHKALRAEVEAGHFRADLMYRLRVVPIFIPALREQGGDVIRLAQRFIRELNGRSSRRIERIATAAARRLTEHDWPGNVRELRNVIEYAFVIGEGPVLRLADLPPAARARPSRGAERCRRRPTHARAGGPHSPGAGADGRPPGDAAQLLGISRVTLWRQIQRLGLRRTSVARAELRRCQRDGRQGPWRRTPSFGIAVALNRSSCGNSPSLFAILIGVLMGLLGGGGSVLLVPVLLYVLRLDAKSALATSQLVMVSTSLVAMVVHAGRQCRPADRCAVWPAGDGWGLPGRTFRGLRPGSSFLLLGFVSLMLLSALQMLRGATGRVAAVPGRAPSLRAVFIGFPTGVVAGLLGAGGGFLIVPALSLFAGLPMAQAVGTSLLVITMQSVAGASGYLRHASVNPSIVVWLSVAMATSSILGGLLARRLPAAALRRIFAALLLVVASFMLLRSLLAA